MKEPNSPDSPLADLCRQRGLKLTGQRRTIAFVLSDSDDHPDVEELYRRAVEVDPRISIATVYRTVRLFEENGILQRRDFGGGRARYEVADGDHGDHYHLIDADTGKVIEFENAELDALLDGIVRQMGYDLVTTRLSVVGRRKAKPRSRG
ncbi:MULTISPECIES: Fur family transcriptional regulator [Komagataeibacter]|uniref:Ferric uptake regulation protein n=4 Tax=Komagataeibacter TaxID=1434011 RepID=A0A318QXF1_9PROT|nr:MULTISPECIES: Fur family transcriptional regulator [Komagataeibacter]GBR38882.1 Fur family transcriptional regulator [Komagataeibacter oboediens DSM 11826]KPH86881.1 Fur family transcriptional regulator [Komagataeibacter intermedius AF2]MBL7233533.1 transcriptional repressor [Komagataeibacter oboediens]MBT0675055.1 transcriptional repressor [Komagataeibacter oboediens]MBT0678408.1 transcriptional repressor [Komagataeibacter oboediens]